MKAFVQKYIAILIALLLFLSIVVIWLVNLRLTSGLFGDKTTVVIIAGAIAMLLGIKGIP